MTWTFDDVDFEQVGLEWTAPTPGKVRDDDIGSSKLAMQIAILASLRYVKRIHRVLPTITSETNAYSVRGLERAAYHYRARVSSSGPVAAIRARDLRSRP